jgi:hypothetical protein
VPHERACPQVSGIVPQLSAGGHAVSGMHGVPHTFGVPVPPHVSVPVHTPHLTNPWQPSGSVPQLCPGVQDVFGTQHTFGIPPAPHN